MCAIFTNRTTVNVIQTYLFLRQIASVFDCIADYGNMCLLSESYLHGSAKVNQFADSCGYAQLTVVLFRIQRKQSGTNSNKLEPEVYCVWTVLLYHMVRASSCLPRRLCGSFAFSWLERKRDCWRLERYASLVTYELCMYDFFIVCNSVSKSTWNVNFYCSLNSIKICKFWTIYCMSWCEKWRFSPVEYCLNSDFAL